MRIVLLGLGPALVFSSMLLWSAPSVLATGGQSPEGVTEQQIVVGMSSPVKGTSRSLGIELYRGSMAYLSEINSAGGIHGRTIALKAYDDGYQPDQAVKNTLKL